MRNILELDVTASFVEEFVFNYGPPASLVSNNGPQFESFFLQGVCDIMKIANSFTCHPQAIGHIERFNLTITAMLRYYVENHPTDWCHYFKGLC